MADILEVIFKGTDQVTPVISGIADKFKSIGGTLTGVGTKMTAGLTLPLAGAAFGAISMASDVAEAGSKVDVVFGDMSKSVTAWSQDADQAFGLSDKQALGYTGTLGNLFTSMGLGQDVAADMSMSLTGLTSDFSSFNNMNQDEVFQKITSAMAGETDGLKSLGINANAAAVEAEALNLGLVKQGEELSASAKAQAIYSIMMKESKNAQGDFARTSTGLANQQRILKAEFSDVAAGLGQVLLPVATQLVGVIREAVTWFGNLSPEVKTTIVVVAGVVAAIGPVLVIVGQLVTAIGAIIPVVTAVAGVLTFPLIAIIGLVVAAIAGLYLAWTNNWGGIQDKVKVAADFIVGLVDTFLGILRSLWTEHGDGLLKDTKGLWDAIQSVIESVSGVIQGIIETVLGIMTKVWEQHGADIIGFVETAFETIRSVIDGVITIIRGIIQTFTGLLTGDWETFTNGLKTVWSGAWQIISSTVSGVIEAIKLAVGLWVSGLQASWDTFTGALQTAWDGAWNTISTKITTITGSIKTTFEGWIGSIKTAWETLTNTDLPTLWGNAWDAILGKLTDIKTSIGTAVEGIITAIKNFFINTDWGKVGSDIIQGIADGIAGSGSVIGKILDKILPDSIDIPVTVSGGGGGGKGGKPASNTPAVPPRSIARASGGPLFPGTLYKFGEAGTEYGIFGQAGYMLSHSQSMAIDRNRRTGNGNPVQLVLNYAPMISTASAIEVERELKPLIERVINNYNSRAR